MVKDDDGRRQQPLLCNQSALAPLEAEIGGIKVA
jgi:hypothetical protein